MSDAEPHVLICPCCGGELLFDAAQGSLKVVSPPATGQAAPSLEEIQQRMEARKASRTDAFGEALKAERSRKDELNELFKQASEKAGESEEDERPDNPLDERWR